MYYTIRQAVGTEQLYKLELASSQLTAWWFSSQLEAHISPPMHLYLLISTNKTGPESRCDDQQLWSYMLDHDPCVPLHIALLLCFPLGKCGHHHSPALQAPLLQGFEERHSRLWYLVLTLFSTHAHQAWIKLTF